MAKKKLWAGKVKKGMEQRGTTGKFRKWCQQHGFSKVTAECIAMGLRAGGSVARMAKLAKGFATMRKKRRQSAYAPPLKILPQHRTNRR